MVKRVKLPVTNEELREEFNSGMPVTFLAKKYNCSTSVIYIRLQKQDKIDNLKSKSITGYEIISMPDAIRLTGLTRHTIGVFMKNGELPFSQMGKKYMFKLRDIYKMIGVDINDMIKPEMKMDDYFEKSELKSSSIEHVVETLVSEIKVMKKSLMDDNRQVYDREVMNALKIINESQNEMNDKMIAIKNDQNKINDEFSKIKEDIIKFNNNDIINVSTTKTVKNDSLDKFGGR